MEELKLIYEILNMAWKIIRDFKSGKIIMSENEWEEMKRTASDKMHEIENHYGMNERYLFTAIYHAMADYIGRKEKDEKSQRI